MNCGRMLALGCAVLAAGTASSDDAFVLKDMVHVYENPVPQLKSRQALFPGLCELPDGTVVCSFTISEALESVDMRSYLAESTDGGRTWSKPHRMFREGPLPESECCKATSLGGDRMVAFGYRAQRPDPEQTVSNPKTGGLLSHWVFCSFSEDRGRTWLDPIRVPDAWRAQTEASAPLVRLADGTLTAPISGFPDWEGRMASRRCGRAMTSRDGGRTWNDDVVCMDFGDPDVSCYEQRFCVLDSGTVVDIGWNENLATGRRLPNHVTYSTDGCRSFSKPISTGVLGQSASVCALGGERFMAVVARRRDTDAPGVYGYVVDFSDRTWNVEKSGMIWSAGRGPIKRDRKMAETFGFLKMGQPSVTRLGNGRLLFCLWYQKDGQYYVDVGEVSVK